jgi:hypothetical protein
MRIEVSIRISDKSGPYETTDVAAAKVETNAPWDEVKPTAVHRALDSVIEDVVERVEKQLKAEHMKRREAERATEVVDEFA